MAYVRRYLPHLVLAIGAFVMLLPFYWMFLTSIRSPGEIFDVSLWPIPKDFSAGENFSRAASQVPMARFMLNGVIVCLGILIVQVLTAVPAAYALAKLRFPGRRLLMTLVIAALCVPIQALALPLFVGLAMTELLNTYFAMMAPFFLSVFAIFLFHQSFRSYPNEIIEAARMDGFSEMEICWRLVLRGSLPSLAAFSVFSLVAHWNDLYWPMIVVSDTTRAAAARHAVFRRRRVRGELRSPDGRRDHYYCADAGLLPARAPTFHRGDHHDRSQVNRAA